MKKIIFFILLLSVSSLVFVGCKKDNVEPAPEDTKPDEKNVLPANFMIDVPSSLSDESSGKRSVSNDTLSGAFIYQNLRTFIRIGEVSAELVQEIITAIRTYNISPPMDITYTSDDDSRTKHLVVVANKSYEGTAYEYHLTVTDQQNEDTAFQVYWDESPIKGVAILNPYHSDRTNPITLINTMYKIEYSEAETDYEKQMIVSISDYPINPLDSGSIDNLKMFVGKNGNILTIYGNSNHPLLVINDTSGAMNGISYSFVAYSDKSQNIGVAEVALPPSNVTTNTNILTDYNVRDMLAEHLSKKTGWPPSTFYYLLTDALPPAFFDNTGFVSAVTAPNNGKDYSAIDDLSGLTPYVPNDVRTLVVLFGN